MHDPRVIALSSGVSVISKSGLMSRRAVDDSSEFTCSIVTRDAVGPVSEVHTRMPIALPKETEAAWLDSSLTDSGQAIAFAREQSITEFVYYAVNSRVNNSRSEGAELIEPFEISA